MFVAAQDVLPRGKLPLGRTWWRSAVLRRRRALIAGLAYRRRMPPRSDHRACAARAKVQAGPRPLPARGAAAGPTLTGPERPDRPTSGRCGRLRRPAAVSRWDKGITPASGYPVEVGRCRHRTRSPGAARRRADRDRPGRELVRDAQARTGVRGCAAWRGRCCRWPPTRPARSRCSTRSAARSARSRPPSCSAEGVVRRGGGRTVRRAVRGLGNEPARAQAGPPRREGRRTRPVAKLEPSDGAPGGQQREERRPQGGQAESAQGGEGRHGTAAPDDDMREIEEIPPPPRHQLSGATTPTADRARDLERHRQPEPRDRPPGSRMTPQRWEPGPVRELRCATPCSGTMGGTTTTQPGALPADGQQAE